MKFTYISLRFHRFISRTHASPLSQRDESETVFPTSGKSSWFHEIFSNGQHTSRMYVSQKRVLSGR